MNIHELLTQQAANRSAKPAVIYKDQSIAFAQLRDEAGRLAGALRHLGFGPSDKTAIFLPNCPEYIYSYFATFLLGGIVVPLDFMLTEVEMINFINHSQSSILILRRKKGIDCQQIKQRCPSLKKIILMDPSSSDPVHEAPDERTVYYQSLRHPSSLDNNEVDESAPAAIFYTSGSTGHPKGVVLTYGHLDNPVACIRHFLNPTAEDSYLCAGIPFSHVGGLDYIIFMLSFGSTLVLMDRFQPMEALKNIERYGASIFCIVPAMFAAIVSLKEAEKFDLSSLRHLVVFGAPSSPALLQRFHQLCPRARLSNGWGMTETAAPNTYSPDDVTKINSIGPFGVGMEAKIVNEAAKPVTDGEKGELWVRGKAVMAGYYNEEALTRQVITPDGWLRTGDIARRDHDGNFYLAGRKREMIKVAGEIVMEPEVEDVLYRHPSVQDAAVIGIADPVRGEIPKALVVLKPHAEAAVDELKPFLKKYLAHFKIPAVIEQRQALPKNRTGKIDKETLRREHQAMTADEGAA